MVGIDDGAAVDAAEAGSREALFESAKGVLGEVAAGGGDDADGIGFGLEGDDVAGVEEVEIGTDAADDAAGSAGAAGVGADRMPARR